MYAYLLVHLTPKSPEIGRFFRCRGCNFANIDILSSRNGTVGAACVWVRPEGKDMNFRILVSLGAVAAALALGGCTSSRIGSLNTAGSQPEALTPAPTGNVQQSQLPPPATPQTPAAGQFPTPPDAPAGATQVATATPPAGANPATAGGADVSPGSVAGVWNANVGGQSCRIATPQTSFGPGFRAAPLGCPAPVAGLKAWAAKGKQLVLFDENGAQIASLYSSGGSKFDGQTTDGKPISLTR
jgi:Protease inhibitor Inh